jgi:hypothetical protein
VPFLTPTVSQVSRFVAQSVRSVKILAHEDRIPRPLRWLVAAGLLPVPGPFDEAVLLVAASILFTFYRQPLHDAWRQAQAEGCISDSP